MDKQDRAAARRCRRPGDSRSGGGARVLRATAADGEKEEPKASGGSAQAVYPRGRPEDSAKSSHFTFILRWSAT